MVVIDTIEKSFRIIGSRPEVDLAKDYVVSIPGLTPGGHEVTLNVYIKQGDGGNADVYQFTCGQRNLGRTMLPDDQKIVGAPFYSARRNERLFPEVSVVAGGVMGDGEAYDMAGSSVLALIDQNWS